MQRIAFRPSAILALVALVGSPAVADTKVFSCNAPRPRTLLMTVSEGPDPVGASIWKDYDPNDGTPSAVGALNASGELRDDGPPALAFRAATGWPYAIWAYNAGADHDIAFSEWDGCGWTPTIFLTATTDDELDPFLFVDRDANLYAVWWVDDPVRSRVMFSFRDHAASSWSVPVEVTDAFESGRRPSVAAAGGKIAIAYERQTPLQNMPQEVVVATMAPTFAIVRRVVAATQRTDRLDPVVETRDGRQWVGWKHGDAQFGWSLAVQPNDDADGTAADWNDVELLPWNDPSWIGVAGMRAWVRREALRGQPSGPTDPDVYPAEPEP